MNSDNPYAAPQTPLVKDDQRVKVPDGMLGKPDDFLWFRAGALLWLVNSVAILVAICLADRIIGIGLMLVFLLGTLLLATIPAKTPGRVWFACSILLQVISPVIAMQALQDVPNPDWDRFFWYQRLGFWGEFLALICVLIGLIQLATWLQFSLLRKLAKAAAVLVGFNLLFDAWGRAQHFGYEGILIGLIWVICGIVPLFILLILCWISATLVPHYVGLPIIPPYDPLASPTKIDNPK